MHTGRYWDPATKKHTSGDGPGGRAYSALPFDWDGDGDLDLVVGTDKGDLHLRVNEGTPQKPAFATATRPLGASVPGGYAMPVAADWDGDGRQDLLSGSQQGGVYWFRNVGAASAPKLEPPRLLVAISSRRENQPGLRSQVTVADYDGDGDLDLLVGDNHAKQVDGEHVWHGWIWLYRHAGEPQAAKPPTAKSGSRH